MPLTDGKLTRHYDWATRLREFEQERSAMPFVWGANDCCLYAADAVQAITGIDPAEGHRDYDTEQKAVTKFCMFGSLENMVESIAHRAGLAPVEPKKAKRGDLALCFWDGKHCLCVLGTGCYPMGPTERGIVALPRGSMRKAWSVG